MQLLFGVVIVAIIVLAVLYNGRYVNNHPRKLTATQREQFLQMLGGSPKGTVNVTSILGDSESVAFATELDSLLNIAGWPTQGVNRVVFTENPTGLIITVNSIKETPPHAGFLQHTFKAIGFPTLAEIHEEDPLQSLNLTVGRNPEPA